MKLNTPNADGLLCVCYIDNALRTTSLKRVPHAINLDWERSGRYLTKTLRYVVVFCFKISSVSRTDPMLEKKSLKPVITYLKKRYELLHLTHNS